MTSRWLVALVVVVALVFAVQGGEYSTFAWLKLRREERAEVARVAELQRTVDSLLAYAKKVETDPETQERIAREQYRMLKPGEHVFLFLEGKDRQP